MFKKFTFMSFFILCATLINHEAFAQRRNLNDLVKIVVQDLAKNRAGGGYDINQAFTKDLDYGSAREAIRATNRESPTPKPTMCVAAVSEIIIETLNKFTAQSGDSSPFTKLPVKSWTSGTVNSARANIFMYAGTGSRGTGHAFAKLGIGEEKTFDRLIPYDFVNLNRSGGSGHSVVFISYLGRDYQELPRYSPDVVGFKYFSAQGKGRADAGFAYRYAYFGNYCPGVVAGKPRDCGVIKSLTNLALLDGGQLWHPAEWKTEEALNAIRSSRRRSIELRFQEGAPRSLIDAELEADLAAELQPAFGRFTGETLD